MDLDITVSPLRDIARSVFTTLQQSNNVLISQAEEHDGDSGLAMDLHHDSLVSSILTRQAGSVPSLQSLSRDAVLLILTTNNNKERQITPVVDRLGL